MRCACCGRSINPASAVTKVYRHESAGGLVYSKTSTYGPVCAVRLGITKPAPKLKRKPGRFAIFKKSQAVKVDEFQSQLFGVMA